MSDKKKALVKALAKKKGQRLEYPPSGPKYVSPTMIGRVSVK